MSLLGALLVVLAGQLAGRALLPARERLERSRWEEACLAQVLGTCALALGAQLLGWAGLPFGVPAAGLLLGAALLFDGRRVLRDRGAALAAAPGGRGLHLLLGVLAAGSVLGSVVFPLNEFDAILHFALKAKVILAEGGVTGPGFTAVTEEFGRIMTHPNYPPGLPYLEALAAQVGGWDERWVQLPLAFWVASLPGLAAFGLRPFGDRAAAAGALLLACTPMLVIRDLTADWPFNLADAGLGADIMLGGRGDLALAATTAAACALLVHARRGAGLGAAALAGLALAGGVLFKNEGLAVLLAVALAQLLGFLAPGPRPWRAAGAAVGVALLLASPWLLQRGGLPAIDENYSEHLTPARLAAAFEPEEAAGELFGHRAVAESAADAGRPRAAVVAGYFGTEALDLLSWGLLWPLFVLGLAVPLAAGAEERRWLGLLVLGVAAAYALILLVTPWYLPSLRTTGIPERLLLHLVGPAAMVAGAARGAARGEERAATMP